MQEKALPVKRKSSKSYDFDSDFAVLLIGIATKNTLYTEKSELHLQIRLKFVSALKSALRKPHRNYNLTFRFLITKAHYLFHRHISQTLEIFVHGSNSSQLEQLW